MKRFELLLLLGLALADGLSPAQTAKPADKSSGRYLFILESSSAMRRRADAVLDTVQSMLKSDLNGQLRPGDTVGIWTFNEALYAGQFPLQRWSPERRDAVTLAVSTFLKIQRYEKQALPERLLPDLERVIGTSEAITVLLISAGEKEIPGPLFGTEVNATFTQWSRQMQRTRMPFVTVLRARKGQIVGRRVSMAPWPVTFPEFPPEPAPAVAAKPPQASPVRKPAPAAAPKTPAPIILDMSQSAKAEAKSPGQAATVPPTPVPIEPVKPAAKTRVPEIPQPTSASAPSSKPVEPVTTTAAAPGPVQPAAPPIQGPLVLVERPKAGSAQMTAVPPVAVSTPQPQTTPSDSPAAVAVPQPEPAAAAIPQPTEAPPPLAEDKPAVAQVGMQETAGAPSAVTVTSALQKPTPLAPAGPPRQTAVTVPPEQFFTGKTLIAAAAVLLAVVIGVLILFLRRARTTAHASLITRSMDRKQE